MIKKSKQSINSDLSLTRITRTLFFFCVLSAIYIIVADSGNLLTDDAVIQRWALTSGLFVLTTFSWYVASLYRSPLTHRIIIGILTLALIVFCGFTTYYERGMASTSTIMYALPLLTIATLRSRHALLATAALCAGTYAFAAVLYFKTFFNEGYRIQLWSTMLLYIGAIFVITWLIMIIANLRKDSL